ncbi:transcriptional regulator [Streptomyces sp. MMG1533]|uniref:GAF domain-containing protein n=1 Tax=Streptomyces sp. MMG1533 TaxID=1415546 RepID=UPI0006AFF776|nr:GAF domain-containing protein [Streptomyces sp. MMG1533]KOU57498.1 transcriptional regulator [Streptomyces sp. MMG1533]
MDASTAATTATVVSASALRASHERFVTGSGTLPGVRSLVAESWRRCAAGGVRPDGSPLPPLRGTAEQLAAYRRQHPLAAVLPLFRELLGAGAADDGHVFAVGDADGTLLWVEGDSAAMRRAERMHFVEGAVWSEAQAGTNAPGLVLEVGYPVQIVAGEHYSSAVHDWSCAAAPVRDPASGRALGVIDLSGGGTIATPPALAAVRGTALAAEAELARARFAPGALLGPDGRVLSVPAAAGGCGVRLAALGRDSALLDVAGRVHRLSPRHSEIVVALALEGRGVPGDRLAVDLSDREVPTSTLRAEMTRLRAVLGPDLLGSRPYELMFPVRTDFGEVAALLAEGRVAEALERYSGPLMPRSEAPVVVEHRQALEQQLRGAVLGGGDAGLLRRWVNAAWGADDAAAWQALARGLPGGSPQRAAAAARARALDAASAAPLHVGRHAAVLQRSRS